MSELPTSLSKYIVECNVPDFSNVSGTAIEEVTMKMEFIASRINDLTSQLNVATENHLDDIGLKRECYLRKLKNNVADFEAEKRFP